MPSRRVRGHLATAAALAASAAVAAYSWRGLHGASLAPALLGLVPWLAARYLVCPLRWHAITASGRNRRWHLRVYAEAEFFGVLSPAHSGTDLWRIRCLRRCGLHLTSAAAEVGLDRLVGGLGLLVFLAFTGTALSPVLVVGAAVVGVLMVAAAVLAKRLRFGLLRERPLPTPAQLAVAVPLAVVYQLLTAGVLLGAVHAVGQTVSPFDVLAVSAAGQAAGVLPGMHGLGPREGAVLYGLTHLGLPLHAAVAAISLTAALTLLPPLVLGGGTHVVRRLRPSLAAA